MWRAFPAIMAALDRNPEVRAVLLSGAGDDFSAGADIAEFDVVRADTAQATAYEVAVDACCDAIMDLSKPTVAVIRGYCLGGAVHLAMACDFRYASSSASFGIPAAKLSIVYGRRGTARLLALVGLTQAKRILYSGDRFDAATARRIGLVDNLSGQPAASAARTGWWRRTTTTPVAAGDPMADARVFARTLTDNAPLSIAGAKTILDGLALAQSAIDTPAMALAVRRAAASDDYREGRAAFAEKRKPRFAGR
jgi:enoyl-CoA hydratase/carnithine racemase